MPDELTWLPAWKIREPIGSNQVSPVEVTEHFLARIEELNPTLKALAALGAIGAHERAQRAEEALRRGDRLGSLQLASARVIELDQWAAALNARGRNWQRSCDLLIECDLLLSVTSQLLPKTVEEWATDWTTDGASDPRGTFAPVDASHT